MNYSLLTPKDARPNHRLSVKTSGLVKRVLGHRARRGALKPLLFWTSRLN